MMKKNNCITRAQYDAIYKKTYPECKALMESKGVNDAETIDKYTIFVIDMMLKKSHCVVVG